MKLPDQALFVIRKSIISYSKEKSIIKDLKEKEGRLFEKFLSLPHR